MNICQFLNLIYELYWRIKFKNKVQRYRDIVCNKNYLPAKCLRAITVCNSSDVLIIRKWSSKFFINSWELFQSRQSLQEKEVSAVEQNTATTDQRYQIYRSHYNEFFQKNAQLCNKASCCIPDLVTPYKSDFC